MRKLTDMQLNQLTHTELRHVGAMFEEIRDQLGMLVESNKMLNDKFDRLFVAVHGMGEQIAIISWDIKGLKTNVAELKTDVAVLKTDMRRVKSHLCLVDDPLLASVGTPRSWRKK